MKTKGQHLLLFLIALMPLSAFSQVTFRWLGISGFVLSDQKTTLVFDPAITRVGLLDYLPFTKVQTDKEEVDHWLGRCKVTSVQGTFVNHAHTDHVIDAPYVVRKFGGKLYGSTSVMNVGLGQGLTKEQIQVIRPGEDLVVGDFTVHAYPTPHPPHLMGIILMDGHIDAPLPTPTSAWNYLVGDTFSYLIKHPKGTILFQAIGRVTEVDPLRDIKADVVLLTIANRPSTENLMKRMELTGAKSAVPLHYDNFFFKMKRDGDPDVLWGVNVEEFKQTFDKKGNGARLRWPGYCEEITLLTSEGGES